MSNQIIAEASIDVNEAPRQAEQAQQTANTANGGVNNINDPNKLGPAEKATLKRKYDTDVLLYGMDKQKLTSSQLSTTELDNAMNALSAYMTPLFSDMTTTDTVNRDALNTVYKDFDTADKNADSAFTNMVSSAASDAMVAGNQAKIAGSEAIVAGNQASQAASNASVQASVAVSNANVAQSSVVAAIAKAGFASDAASTANSNANIAINNAASAAGQAGAALSNANVAISSAASALEKVNGMQIGDINLIPNSKVEQTDYHYGFATISNTIYVEAGKTYTLLANGRISDYAANNNRVLMVALYDSSWVKLNVSLATKSITDTTMVTTFVSGFTGYVSITSYDYPSDGGTEDTQNLVTINWYKLVEGNAATYNWSASPEDIQEQFTDINGQLESKVSQTTYDALAGTVSENSTLSKQNQNALVNKADSQTVNLLKQTVDSQATSIDETAKKVELKADESKVDTIAGTVDSQAATLKIMAGDISGLTNSTKTLGGQYTNLSGQFKLSSKQLTTTMSKVDGLDSFKKNYFSISEFDKNKYVWADSGSNHSACDFALLPNTVYTISTNHVRETADGYFDVFAGNKGFVPSSPANGLGHGKPLTVTTDSTGILTVTTRLLSIDDGTDKIQIEKGNIATDWSPAPEDQATVTALTQVKQTAEGAQALATNNKGDITSLQATAKGLQTSVSNAATKDQLNILSDTFSNEISSATSAANSKMIQTINNASIGFKNPDGTTFQMNLSADGTALMDFSKIMLNGATNIANGTIGTAQIADAAITNAKIGKLAVGTAQIADLAVTSAKVSEIDAGLIKSGTVDTNRLNADAIIANVINGKTINGITINTPTLNLGLNGQFIETYNYTQDTSWFLPKKASGDVTFNHGVIEDQGTMQTYANGVWGGMNDSSVFTAGLTNNVWTEYAPGYYKIDMYKQGSTTNVLQRTYADPTGFYYTSPSGDVSYFGNVLSVPQVQTGGVLTPYIGPSKGALRLQIGQNGKDSGLQVGSYDGKEAVLSDFIYNTTYSNSPNVYITPNGRLVRSTSASKYKYNIKNPDIETTLGDRLLNVHLATWNDKRAVDSYAEQLSTGEEREKTSIDKYYGLIAEQLRDAGLDMFISYGKNHEIEGIQYDRAWVPLLPKMRQMNDKINEYELRISKLEAEK